MTKIVVTYNGATLKEYTINKSRITLGRRTTNDLVIDHLTVSGQHAAIDTTSNGSYIVDLGSTNGTLVNGQPVKKHLLQHGDIIDIGKYKLRFESERPVNLSNVQTQTMERKPVEIPTTLAHIKVLSGANAGKELILSKPVTTIGRPGVQVVVITRQGQDYFVTCIEGNQTSMINGIPFTDQAVLLKHKDVLELSGTKMEFWL